jgi:branched-subunit amino acid transport protein
MAVVGVLVATVLQRVTPLHLELDMQLPLVVGAVAVRPLDLAVPVA